MAKREQIPPLLTRRRVVRSDLFRNIDDDGVPVLPPVTASDGFAVIALKASIGSFTETYVLGVWYMSPRKARNSLSCRDISLSTRFMPIRDDPQMVVNLELRLAEAGLQRRGVAA